MTIDEFLTRVPLQMTWQSVASRPNCSANSFHYLYTLTNPTRPAYPMTGFYSKGLAHCVLIRALPSMGSGCNLLLGRGGRPREDALPEPARLRAGEAYLYRRVTKMTQLDAFCRQMGFNYEPIPPTLVEILESLQMDMGHLSEYNDVWDFIDGNGYESAREGGRVWEELVTERKQLIDLLGPADYHVFVSNGSPR